MNSWRQVADTTEDFHSLAVGIFKSFVVWSGAVINFFIDASDTSMRRWEAVLKFTIKRH